VTSANRAPVPPEVCKRAVEILEAPEPSTATEDDDGRRIEKVPGGWMVLKAKEYSAIVKREHQKDLTRERVNRFCDRKRLNKPLPPPTLPPITTPPDHQTSPDDLKRDVTLGNAEQRDVTPSDTDTNVNLEREANLAKFSPQLFLILTKALN
jgi:hypothetical protein